MHLRQITDLEVQGKTILLRLDLNLPRSHGRFTDLTRIIRSIPTIKYLQDQNAKIVIISHMGQPKGKFIRELSLAIVADEIEKLIGKKVHFFTKSIGQSVKNRISNLELGEILLLENLRFNVGEEENSQEFIQELKQLGDIFINDTFSCSHRKHSSIYGLARKMPSAGGFSLIKELETIQTLLKNPASPFIGIIGGSKISTKLNLLHKLIDKVNCIVLAGAMANSFLYALGYDMQSSLVEKGLKSEALEIIEKAKRHNKKIIIPKDFIVTDSNSKIALRSIGSSAIFLNEGEKIMDIGPESVGEIKDEIMKAKTLVWNGPLGAFELKYFDNSSISITRYIVSATINKNLKSIIGGGDTIAAAKSSGLINYLTYTSTGGGAFLQWLEGKELPGIQALLNH